MSATSEPSFWACFTFEFIKTVQRLPRSAGSLENSAFSWNSAADIPTLAAKVDKNDPHPEEQASFS